MLKSTFLPKVEQGQTLSWGVVEDTQDLCPGLQSITILNKNGGLYIYDVALNNSVPILYRSVDGFYYAGNPNLETLTLLILMRNVFLSRIDKLRHPIKFIKLRRKIDLMESVLSEVNKERYLKLLYERKKLNGENHG